MTVFKSHNKQAEGNMFKRNTSQKGFTMVELLVVLIIVAILAAVATPLYLNNIKRARVSEAIATMGLIRQAMRDYKIKSNTYFDVAANSQVGNIQNAVPLSTAINTGSGAVTGADNGLSIDVGVSQYFSNSAFTVDAAGTSGLSPATGQSGKFTGPNAQNFVIRANGNATTVTGFGQNNPCTSSSTSNCATKGTEVLNYLVEMDDSGRIFVSYGVDSANAPIWEAY